MQSFKLALIAFLDDSFDFEQRQYVVDVKDISKTFNVDIEKVYYIYDYGHYYAEDGKTILYNEFYTKPNRLYIYKVR